MTMGAERMIDLVRGATSQDLGDRRGWGDVCGRWLVDYSPPDHDETRILAPVLLWTMCIEPSADEREDFVDSLGTMAELERLLPRQVAELMGWLAVTGTSGFEADNVETFRAILERTGATPVIPLTPERSAPLVDLLRGITSTLPTERRDAARLVPEMLSDLRAEEIGCFAGVLARAFVLEEDAEARTAQLETLCVAVELDAGGRSMVADAVAARTDIPSDLSARWNALTSSSAPQP